MKKIWSFRIFFLPLQKKIKNKLKLMTLKEKERLSNGLNIAMNWLFAISIAFLFYVLVNAPTNMYLVVSGCVIGGLSAIVSIAASIAHNIYNSDAKKEAQKEREKEYYSKPLINRIMELRADNKRFERELTEEEKKTISDYIVKELGQDGKKSAQIGKDHRGMKFVYDKLFISPQSYNNAMNWLKEEGFHIISYDASFFVSLKSEETL